MTGSGFRRLLDVMGFYRGGISETILTTVSPDGFFNAAPMGIRRTSDETLELRPYKSSSTFTNLIDNSNACINVTDNPGLFFVTAFRGKPIDGLHEPVIDKKMRIITSVAHIFVDASRGSDISRIQANFTCQVKGIEVKKMMPRSFSRGKAEAIEAIIHATRIEVFLKERRMGDVERLIKSFAECKDVVGRVSASDSVEIKVIREIDKMIVTWKGKV
tara:strand:+ start:730 stop:1380 length:651 start_codon:yes stop_codon:yes gene_type:complete